MSKWRDLSWRERPWVVYMVVRQLQPNAYGAAIQEEIEKQYGHDMSAGGLHILLDRFVEEGYLRFEIQVDAESGRRRKFFFATGKPRPVMASKTQPDELLPGLAKA